MRVAAGERAAAERYPGVRGAHLVVREDQVRAADLDVEHRAQVLGGDRRALHVPARPARAERRVPARLARPRGAPDQDVQRVLLPRPPGVAAPLGRQLEHGPGVQPGQRAERRIGGPAEVQVRVHVVERATVA